MLAALPCEQDGKISLSAKDGISELAKSATAIACGPGIGRSQQLTDLVCWLYESVGIPMVMDADALFALAQNPEQLATHAGPRILTPHPGEFGRFLTKQIDDRGQLEARAGEIARENGLVMVLKGNRTLVTDGAQSTHNETGNPGMATGGSGDVLTGVITALIGQGLSPLDAARLGAHVHGLVGDLAAQELGAVSLIASDLVNCLPKAFQQFTGT